MTGQGRAGRPPLCSDDLRRLVIQLHRDGRSLRAISKHMNQLGHPTPSGKSVWTHGMVFDLLATRHVREFLEVPV
jgi:hypothetical protein